MIHTHHLRATVKPAATVATGTVARKPFAQTARLAIQAALAVAIMLGASIVGAGVASAAAPPPSDEMVRMYSEFLGREPDSSGLAQYQQFVDQDCRWGIQSAAFKIANSDEAHDKGRNNAETLYRALLDREPDSKGEATYAGALGARGLRWSVAAMMASSEYRNRLERICAGQDSTQGVMMPNDEAADYADELYRHSGNLLKVCGVLTAVRKLDKLAKSKKPAATAVGVDAYITNQVIKFAGVDLGGCKAAVAMMRAGIEVDRIRTGHSEFADPGGVNPVFFQQEVRERRVLIVFTSTDFDIRIGPNPTEWKPFSARKVI